MSNENFENFRDFLYRKVPEKPNALPVRCLDRLAQFRRNKNQFNAVFGGPDAIDPFHEIFPQERVRAKILQKIKLSDLAEFYHLDEKISLNDEPHWFWRFIDPATIFITETVAEELECLKIPVEFLKYEENLRNSCRKDVSRFVKIGEVFKNRPDALSHLNEENFMEFLTENLLEIKWGNLKDRTQKFIKLKKINEKVAKLVDFCQNLIRTPPNDTEEERLGVIQSCQNICRVFFKRLKSLEERIVAKSFEGVFPSKNRQKLYALFDDGYKFRLQSVSPEEVEELFENLEKFVTSQEVRKGLSEGRLTCHVCRKAQVDLYICTNRAPNLYYPEEYRLDHENILTCNRRFCGECIAFMNGERALVRKRDDEGLLEALIRVRWRCPCCTKRCLCGRCCENHFFRNSKIFLKCNSAKEMPKEVFHLKYPGKYVPASEISRLKIENTLLSDGQVIEAIQSTTSTPLVTPKKATREAFKDGEETVSEYEVEANGEIESRNFMKFFNRKEPMEATEDEDSEDISEEKNRKMRKRYQVGLGSFFIKSRRRN